MRGGDLGGGADQLSRVIGQLANHEDIEVVAACDITPAAVTAAKHFHPSVSYYDSLDKMLEHEIDAVMVATPAFKHASDAIAALNADKHVLSEVTACWTLAEAQGRTSEPTDDRGRTG
ncbi:MAG: Gfo/Idh/MocA family oxidoreductase, partial [Nitrospirales bacterium]|nr:Gfo/Idh/MocA family oxidoreductase [Nitrospirales bacterium]